MNMNHIYVKKNAIKIEHCNNIIKQLDEKKLEPSSIGKQQLRYYDGIFGNVVRHQEWVGDFINALTEYKETHSFLKHGIEKWSTNDTCNYQKYFPNEYYATEHCEHSPDDFAAKRILVWMFYCNTIKQGGGTIFPQQKFKSKPEAGTLLIWPAGWTHSHLGEPALNEKKYIATGWASFI